MSDPTFPMDHPSVKFGKIGVLLANLGTPDGTDYWSMRRYLSEFLSDKRVIDYPAWKWQPILQGIILTKRPFSSGAAYKSVWNTERNEGPLLTISRDQAEALANRFHQDFGERVIVDFAMRYGNPSTASKVRDLVDQGCDKILFFPLYPQYAGATTATANDAFFKALASEPWQPASRTVPAYYDHPSYISALKGSIQAAYKTLELRPDALVASYHGMPTRYLTQGDPYHCQCQKTSRLLREALEFAEDELITTFQSKFGPEDWLEPATVDEVARLAKAGRRHLAVIAPAFSADCLETLEEIQEEIREAFLHAGGKTFTYIPCLNTSPAHIDMMVEVVKTELAGWI